MVSAIGNDGPLYGTLNNPGDQNNIIGVGGIDFNHNIAPFSSRGMTLWELPYGYGRVKPDLTSFGSRVTGASPGSGCRILSGTSVASPVVTGGIALLLSVIPKDQRDRRMSPAIIKQALHITSTRLEANIFEQGAGSMNLSEAAIFIDSYTPRITAWPPSIDTTDCPYFAPLCYQRLSFIPFSKFIHVLQLFQIFRFYSIQFNFNSIQIFFIPFWMHYYPLHG
eukprot:m.64002 g.64002  ORF g.64002 m.64002 type:complete len:223 (+) comp8096_c0_seq4:1152-1820(+)